MREWIVSDDKKYCSEKCFLESCPTCDVCGVHTETWIENDKGSKFCSNECRSSTLPICEVCGKHMENWLISKDNKTYCSEECAKKANGIHETEWEEEYNDWREE